MQATNFQEGPITVDNTAHPSTTLVTVVVALEVEGALLKVTSALTNSGCSISEGEIEVALSAAQSFPNPEASLTNGTGRMSIQIKISPMSKH